jgi:hypothetical protein
MFVKTDLAMISGQRNMKTYVVLIFLVALTSELSTEHLRGQSPEKQPDEWLEMLKKDPRLKHHLIFDHKVRPTADEWFAKFEKASGLKFAVVPQAKEGIITFNISSGGAPVWRLMQSLAQDQVLDGKWEKTDDGYLLHGTPNGKVSGMAVSTPEAIAKERAYRESFGKRKKLTGTLFDLPKDHPLRVDPEEAKKYAATMKIIPPKDPPGPDAHHADPRLRKRVTINVAMPKVEAALEKLREATGVRFTFAGIQNVQPAVNGIFVNGVPAWEVMDAFAADKKVDGRWEKDGDGYRIVPRGEPLPAPPPVVSAAAEANTLSWTIAAIIAIPIVFLAGGSVVILLLRRRKRT